MLISAFFITGVLYKLVKYICALIIYTLKNENWCK